MQREAENAEDSTLAKLSEACRGFGSGWALAVRQDWCGVESAGNPLPGVAHRERLGVLGPEELGTGRAPCETSGIRPGALLGPHREGGIVLVMGISFPKGGLGLLAERLRLLQPLPQQTNREMMVPAARSPGRGQRDRQR